MCVTVNPSQASALTHPCRRVAFASALGLAGAQMVGAEPGGGLLEAPWGTPDPVSPAMVLPHQTPSWLQGHATKSFLFSGRPSPPPSQLRYSLPLEVLPGTSTWNSLPFVLPWGCAWAVALCQPTSNGNKACAFLFYKMGAL